MGCILTVLLVALILAIDFGITAGGTWLVCWGFGLEFTWPAVIAVWVIFTALCIIARKAAGSKS